MRYSQASRCGTPSLSTVFDFKVRPGTGVQPQSLNRLLATANFLSNYTVQLQCLQCTPGRRVTEKSHFSTLNVGLAGTGIRTQATCLAGSGTNRSTIHYASSVTNSFQTVVFLERAARASRRHLYDLLFSFPRSISISFQLLVSSGDFQNRRIVDKMDWLSSSVLDFDMERL
jgi:hypothetical protein